MTEEFYKQHFNNEEESRDQEEESDITEGKDTGRTMTKRERPHTLDKGKRGGERERVENLKEESMNQKRLQQPEARSQDTSKTMEEVCKIWSTNINGLNSPM
uniref:Uncharacterized protein n=1 Tax=Micrurus paraensis TaxID=1970185 RepID=A0A2D4KQA5_9SAUR